MFKRFKSKLLKDSDTVLTVELTDEKGKSFPLVVLKEEESNDLVEAFKNEEEVIGNYLTLKFKRLPKREKGDN